MKSNADKVATPDDFEDHRAIFQSVSIASAASFAVLVGFLGDTWGNKEASRITIEALASLLFSLAPCVLLLFYMMLHGGKNSFLIKKKRRTLNKLFPLFCFCCFIYTGVILLNWLYKLSAILPKIN